MDGASQKNFVLLPNLIRTLIFAENKKDGFTAFKEGAGDLIWAGAEGLGLETFIYFFLHGEKLIPPEYEEKFSAVFRARSAAELKRFAALHDIFKILSENKIIAAPLKGAALAYTCYPHPALRSMNDFDILVKPGEIHAAWRLMLEHGFTADGVENDKHLPVLRSPSGYALELHRHISESASWPAEYLWAESRTGPFLNAGAALLPPEFSILHAVDHALADNLVCGFKVFIDVAFIIRRERPSPGKLEQLALKLDLYPKLAFFMNIFPGFFPAEYWLSPGSGSEEVLEKARFLILNAGRLQNLGRHELMLSRDYLHLNRKGKLI